MMPRTTHLSLTEKSDTVWFCLYSMYMVQNDNKIGAPKPRMPGTVPSGMVVISRAPNNCITITVPNGDCWGFSDPDDVDYFVKAWFTENHEAFKLYNKH